MPPRLRTARSTVLAAAFAALIAPAAADAASTVIEQPVAFTVKNINRTRLACATDGRTYTVRGHLVGTPAQLASPRGVTLYLHGLGLGEFFWNFKGVPNYNFAAGMARRGHASVVIDRLGYRSSDKAPGKSSCVGGHADMAHQIIQRLKSGSYLGSRSPRFSRVGLVGHSAGGLITQVEAYSFSDARAIGVLAYADQGISNFQRNAGKAAAKVCARGGISSGPGGYALLGQSLPVATRAFFASAPPRVRSAALPLATKNPCGDLASYIAAPATNKRNLSRVKAPVLLVQGGSDKLFPLGSVSAQRKRFTNAKSVTYASLPRTGHALTLEPSRIRLQRAVASFLSRNGL